jgi:hypothetical protein
VQQDYELDFSEGNVKGTDGKNVYKYSPMSYIQAIAFAVKGGDYSHLERLAEDPIMRNEEGVVNSIIYHLLALDHEGAPITQNKEREKRAKAFSVGKLFKTYSEADESENDNKELTEGDMLVNDVVNTYTPNNDTTKCIFTTPTAADKSSTATITGIQLKGFYRLIAGEEIIYVDRATGEIKVDKDKFAEDNKDAIYEQLIPRVEAEENRIRMELTNTTNAVIEAFQKLKKDFVDENGMLKPEFKDEFRAALHAEMIKNGFEFIVSYNVTSKGQLFNNYRSAFNAWLATEDDQSARMAVQTELMATSANAYRRVIFAGEDLAHARDVSKSEEDAKKRTEQYDCYDWWLCHKPLEK